MSSVSSMWCKIQDLHLSITTSIIKLRLVRMYERPSPANKKDVSLECLFHDFEESFPMQMYAFKSFGDVQSMENIHEGVLFGQVGVCSSYYVTKILVNANIPEVADFRQRIVIASYMCTTIISSTSQGTTSSLGDDCMLRTIEQLFFDDQLESSNPALDKIEDDFPIETPSSKLDEELELVDERNVKRSLEDAFSSTIPTKKSKAIIKQEKE
ncbi:hypothetical protein C2S52_013997 [Perilla frutescens var. hirtella]|nr:hypothetical protein C2S52_013997 [Perilla frutescens var. hirtella]